MKIAIGACLFAEGDMDVNACHFNVVASEIACFISPVFLSWYLSFSINKSSKLISSL